MLALDIAGVGASAWIIWAVTGIVSGIVSSLAIGGRRAIWIDICVGLVASLCGGMGCALVISLETAYDVILSAMCGVFLAGVALWIMDEVTLHDDSAR